MTGGDTDAKGAEGDSMWVFHTKRNALREQLVLQAPEVNPSEFIRRYLQQKSLASKLNDRTRDAQSSRSDKSNHQ